MASASSHTNAAGVHLNGGPNGVDIQKQLPQSQDHAQILAGFRCYVADLCQQFGGTSLHHDSVKGETDAQQGGIRGM